MNTKYKSLSMKSNESSQPTGKEKSIGCGTMEEALRLHAQNGDKVVEEGTTSVEFCSGFIIDPTPT